MNEKFADSYFSCSALKGGFIDLWFNIFYSFYRKETKVRFHNSSILYQSPTQGDSMTGALAKAIAKLPSDWLIYEEMARCVSLVDQ